MDIDVLRLADEEAADDEGHRRDDDRVPQTVLDVAGSRDDREGGRRQEPAEPAIANVYPRFGTTMEWDTAAGQAVLEAAGGRVETLAGAPLTYGKPGFKNDGFIAWGRRPAG